MKLTSFELDVMQYLWQQTEATSPEVHAYITKTRDVTYSTVKTIIDRLEQKKVIKRHRVEGRTIYYQTLVTPKEVQKPMLKQVLQKLFAGNKKLLMNQLFEQDDLSQEDIQYLENLIKRDKKL
ncbi:BlaI/MecI/CopY family transcriptional regulator [Marinicella gelatinilytica]|uniref:BlaI/MecI/CopY family transcriptional regulator n=1 Tax=Marinicella gelatinilytica TaxID=2996017 RepID=UPI002260E6FC|nr:BlaI/MecI/CopY family transcriptional regulator [Marinicella gelatinilytica]MCX7545220.1 BlaI/MecI/CopY family transcriptional regulator [Marinicella gelatinilytica]